MTRKIRVVPNNSDASALPGMLMHLRDMKGFSIADSIPDFRGWEVRLRDGRRVGTVDDLIIDTTEFQADYIEVKVDREVIGASEDTWMLVPASVAHIRDKNDCVVIDVLPIKGVADAPRSSGKLPSEQDERAIHDYYMPRRQSGENDTLDMAPARNGRRPARRDAPNSPGGRAN
jgi:hypothetical protein